MTSKKKRAEMGVDLHKLEIGSIKTGSFEKMFGQQSLNSLMKDIILPDDDLDSLIRPQYWLNIPT